MLYHISFAWKSAMFASERSLPEMMDLVRAMISMVSS